MSGLEPQTPLLRRDVTWSYRVLRATPGCARSHPESSLRGITARFHCVRDRAGWKVGDTGQGCRHLGSESRRHPTGTGARQLNPPPGPSRHIDLRLGSDGSQRCKRMGDRKVGRFYRVSEAVASESLRPIVRSQESITADSASVAGEVGIGVRSRSIRVEQRHHIDQAPIPLSRPAQIERELPNRDE